MASYLSLFREPSNFRAKSRSYKCYSCIVVCKWSCIFYRPRPLRLQSCCIGGNMRISCLGHEFSWIAWNGFWRFPYSRYRKYVRRWVPWERGWLLERLSYVSSSHRCAYSFDSLIRAWLSHNHFGIVCTILQLRGSSQLLALWYLGLLVFRLCSWLNNNLIHGVFITKIMIFLIRLFGIRYSV